MRETVLLFHFSDRDKRNRIARALLPLKVKIKEIEKADYLKPVGFLAGNKDIEAVQELYDGPELEGEMMVLAGILGDRMDAVLKAVRKSALVPYKAVLTPTNQCWNVLELFQEIRKEHELMHKKEE